MLCIVSSRLHVGRGSKFIYGSVLRLKPGTYLPFITTTTNTTTATTTTTTTTTVVTAD